MVRSTLVGQLPVLHAGVDVAVDRRSMSMTNRILARPSYPYEFAMVLRFQSCCVPQPVPVNVSTSSHDWPRRFAIECVPEATPDIVLSPASLRVSAWVAVRPISTLHWLNEIAPLAGIVIYSFSKSETRSRNAATSLRNSLRASTTRPIMLPYDTARVCSGLS